jgi:uncharacterized protein (TIGR02246 family)
MTFRETLDKHLKAIQQRNLDALVETLPSDELTLVMSDGRFVRSVREFVELHRGWFESSTWKLETTVVSMVESTDLAMVLLHLEYRDTPASGPAVHETSHLTLVFARRDGQWVMIHDQNTPIKKA